MTIELYRRFARANWSPVALLLLATSVIACGSSGGGGGDTSASSTGQASLTAGAGVVFESGSIMGGNKFTQVDLVATENGDKLRLQTGGAKITQTAPVNWFLLGGVATVFSSLDEVPFEKPTEDEGQPLLSPKTGNGFVLQNYASGGWTRGFITSASASEIIIEYEVVP